MRGTAAALGVALLTIALFWPATGYNLLIFDDSIYIFDNTLIERGLSWDKVVEVFTSIPVREFYIPVTHLSYMLDVSLYRGSVFGFHLTNILLHAANMALLAYLLARMTGSPGKSFFAAALVAFHPLRVESVAWISERKDVLSVFFMLLSLACYLGWARGGEVKHKSRWAWYGALLVCFTLGLMSKPMTVTLPFLLLLLDFWPLGRLQGGFADGRIRRQRVVVLAAEKIPLLLLSVLFTLLAFRTQARSLTWEFPPTERLGHALSAVFLYLRQTFWPAHLGIRFFEHTWTSAPGGLPAPLLGTASVSLLAVALARSRPWLVTGWGWYLAALLPVSGLVPVGGQWLSDRFTYLPHVGLAVALVWTLGEAARRLPRAVPPAAAALLLASLALLTRMQLPFWKDGISLMSRSAALAPLDPYARSALANNLAVRGMIDEAEREYRIALALPSLYRPLGPHLGYARLLELSGRREQAIAEYRKVLDIDPSDFRVLVNLGQIYLAADRKADAIRCFLAVISAYPGTAEALMAEGMIRVSDGDTREAAAVFRRALSSPSLYSETLPLVEDLLKRNQP